MRRRGGGAGVGLILLGITGLWLHHTGRLQAVVDALRGAPPGGLTVPDGLGVRSDATWRKIASCSALPTPACIRDIWQSINSPDDILKGIRDLIGDIF